MMSVDTWANDACAPIANRIAPNIGARFAAPIHVCGMAE
jgi:hypothetical protein